MAIREFNIENDFNKLWSDVIEHEGFFPEEVYYDMTGELIPYLRNSNYENMTAKEKKTFLERKYSERFKDTLGYTLRDDDDNIIGWIYWAWKKKTAYLKYIVVIGEFARNPEEKKYFRKGLGKVMMNMFIRWCIENEIQNVKVSFHRNNKNLQRFYGAYGFEGELGGRIFAHWDLKLRNKKGDLTPKANELINKIENS